MGKHLNCAPTPARRGRKPGQVASSASSAYVIWREVRLTLALTYVMPDDTLPEMVERLLLRLKQIGLHATVLYLDKGFCSGEIISYLQCTQQAAVLACPIWGKQGVSHPG